MECEHCCYSCTKRGKHGDLQTILKAIEFAAEFEGDETITIGGGEPTLHPDFFTILKVCLERFNYVWMATNGSQTAIMRRLADIIRGEDFDNAECHCETDEERDNCTCYDDADILNGADKLCVALSLDCFHDPIDPKIKELWERESKQHRRTGFEIRNVTQSYKGPIAEGRGLKTGAGYAEGCVCSDLFVTPRGMIKLCGCNGAPLIGDIWAGIREEWQEVIYEDEGFIGERCYKGVKRRKRAKK